MPAYTFARTGPLVHAPAEMPGPGPYYTCLVDTHDLQGFPYDYALYYSTDHHNGPGGVWLSLCSGSPTDAGSWVSYDQALESGTFEYLSEKPAGNPIFLDSVQGTGHTETPHVNIVDGGVYMTYHKNGIDHTQATLLATSLDGINFSRINGDEDSVVLSYDVSTDIGDGHTGYFRWTRNPFPGIDAAYVGYSLHGGGNNYHSAIWSSDDAIAWTRIDILTPLEGFTVSHDDLILIWHEIDPASISPIGNGEFVALTGVGTRASGGVQRITELYEIFLAEDGRTLTRESRRVLGVGESGTGDTEELSSPTTLTIDGQSHLIYVGASEQGTVNTIMGAAGSLNPGSDLPPELPEQERRRHIYKRE